MPLIQWVKQLLEFHPVRRFTPNMVYATAQVLTNPLGSARVLAAPSSTHVFMQPVASGQVLPSPMATVTGLKPPTATAQVGNG